MTCSLSAMSGGGRGEGEGRRGKGRRGVGRCEKCKGLGE